MAVDIQLCFTQIGSYTQHWHIIMTIFPVPAFKDNYIWIVHDEKHALIVDPGDSRSVISYLEKHHLTPLALVITHHHPDHIGGIKNLVELYNTPVYGPRKEKIPCMTHPLGEGDTIEFKALNFRAEVIEIPGHTHGHIAYLWEGGMFCGDTLFTCGCGMLKEGTPQQLQHSLQRLASQPDDTLVYCTHEYTEFNTRFALKCEPGNTALQQRLLDTLALRAENKPTLPSTIRLENATNPFLRCKEAEITQTIERELGIKLPPGNELALFTAIINWRDN